jgi:hypothetical protein
MSYARDESRADIGARSSYPATFRIRTATRVLAGLITAVALIFALVVAKLGASGHAPILLIAVVLLVVMVATMARVLTMKLVVREQQVALSSVFGERSLRRQDITGRRKINNKYVRLDTREGRPLSVSLELFQQARAGTWLEDIPDQEELAQAAFLEQVKADTSLGVDVESRMQALKRSRMLAGAVQVAAVGIYFFARFTSGYEGWCMALLAAFPWLALALVAMNPKLLRLGFTKNDPRASVMLALMFPIVALFITSLDLDVFEKIAIWPWAVLPAMLLAGTMLIVSRNEKDPYGWRVAGAVIFACFYGGSSALVGDVMLDTSPVTRFATTVVGHSVSRGKSTRYYLDLAAWGPRNAGEHLSVSKAAFDANPVGASVCMQMHPGALKLPWAAMGSCE